VRSQDRVQRRGIVPPLRKERVYSLFPMILNAFDAGIGK
jgi:hypothetical protein